MSGSSDVSPRHDSDLLYLTDTAYFALLEHESGNRVPSKDKNRPDGLFLERLESFIEGQQKDMESFAHREQRPLDEIRKLVAIPHARYIFSQDPRLPQLDESPRASASNIPSIRRTLALLSDTLQMLHSAAGLDSLLLVVSPHLMPPTSSATPINADFETYNHSSTSSEPYEASWIGGTDLGKEFWMGLKGGGMNGARAFRVKCQMHRDAEVRSPDLNASAATASSDRLHSNIIQATDPDSHPTTKMRSGDVKTELNAAIRHVLRSVSGNPSAEMRWTKPASLEESYNVRLIGWPPGIVMRNPSNNTLKDNRLLLDLVRSGNLKFVQRGSPEWNASPVTIQQANRTFTNETVPQNKSFAAPVRYNPPNASLPSSVINSWKAPALPTKPTTAQRYSRSSCHIPSSLSSLFTPGLAEDANHGSTSMPMVPHPPSRDTSPSGNVAPKRPVAEYTPEEETQEGRKAKRAKLAAAGTAG